MYPTPPPTVLICPLNWGLGHATRCVQIIKMLLSQNCKVVVAADGAPLHFLQNEFSQIGFIRFRGKAIHYPEKGSLALNLLLQAPGLLVSIIKEHIELKKLLNQTGATVVISDNRYGLWNKNARTVFITHQLFIQAPGGLKWLEPLLWPVTRFFIKKFNHCWVPDFPVAPGLSGLLAHKKPVQHVKFVGPLSRFANTSVADFKNPLPKDFPGNFFLCLISGPETQRTKFEELLRNQFEKTMWPVVMVLGKPGSDVRKEAGNFFEMNHAGTSEIAWLIQNARMVICRPGYSTLMDLSVFGKNAILIPTPGQTEQEYLGQMLMNSGNAFCVRQSKLNLEKDIEQALKYPGIPAMPEKGSLLKAAIDDLLKVL